MKPEAQCKLILRHLKSGHKITPLEALRKYGIGRLAARCWDLRQSGYRIQRRMIEVADHKRVAQYWLEGKAA